jgi:hypothetical protein
MAKSALFVIISTALMTGVEARRYRKSDVEG